MPTLVTLWVTIKMLGVDGALDIVADDVGAMALRGHGPCIWVGERNLFIACVEQLGLKCRQTFDFAFQSINAH